MVPFIADILAERAAEHGWSIGAHSYGRPEVLTYGNDGRLVIGRYCSVADNVRILLGGNHRLDWVTTYPFNAFDPAIANHPGHPASKGDVVIGNDVWIGHSVTIVSGVTIGDGACIGAGAVVSKDLPPYAVAAGNPARVHRLRFPPAQVAGLLALRWWDWPPERIRAHYPLLLSGDVAGFLAAAGIAAA